jgi:hypothetical protein
VLIAALGYDAATVSCISSNFLGRIADLEQHQKVDTTPQPSLTAPKGQRSMHIKSRFFELEITRRRVVVGRLAAGGVVSVNAVLALPASHRRSSLYAAILLAVFGAFAFLLSAMR